MRAIAGLAGVVLVAAAGCGGSAESEDLPLGRDALGKATFTPSVHLFAEPVVGRVEVVVDRDHLDPAGVRLDTDFLPYDIEKTAQRRLDRGRYTLLEYDFTLRCLRLDCIPEILSSAAGEAESGRGERRTFRLPPARVLYADDDEEPRTLATARWPELVSVSRIRQSDVPSFGFVFKTNVTPLPDPDYAVPPRLLGAGLFLGALALLALPVALVVTWMRRRRPPPPEVEDVEQLSPLEQALRLVEWTRTRENGAERREALEVLAVELDVEERPELAAAARTLAWSPPTPSPHAAAQLAEEVRAAS